MRALRLLVLAIGLLALVLAANEPARGPSGQTPGKSIPSFSRDVFPLIKKHCLPCHLAESENPSRLALDNYGSLMQGGHHGKAIVSGKPMESSLYLKLLPDPPFGKQMPRSRKKIAEQELRKIYDWIEAGAKEK